VDIHIREGAPSIKQKVLISVIMEAVRTDETSMPDSMEVKTPSAPSLELTG